MPRKTEITLAQIVFAVRKERRQMTGPQGNPLFGDSGLPKMVDLWMLDLIDQSSAGIEIIHVPFDEDAKEKLVQQLTGGLVVANEMPSALAI